MKLRSMGGVESMEERGERVEKVLLPCPSLLLPLSFSTDNFLNRTVLVWNEVNSKLIQRTKYFGIF